MDEIVSYAAYLLDLSQNNHGIEVPQLLNTIT